MNVIKPLHIGIVGCSAEGAAQIGPHAHPEVPVHSPSLAACVGPAALAARGLEGPARDALRRAVGAG